MLDLGVVRGALEMRDDFNKVVEDGVENLGHLEEKVQKMGGPFDMFSEEAVESFESVTKAIGIAVAAVTAGIVAVHELAETGSDVGDVKSAFENLSGGAAQAELNLRALRSGVRGTVDDVALMKEGVRLMSAGVKVGSDEFRSMSEAAFILADRGLGSVEELMGLVSDAMVTGRTRALATKIGVIDLGDAHQNYADKLGVTVDMLSDTAKAEANREQVMKLLNKTISEAAPIQRDYGDAIGEGVAWLRNFRDEVAQGVHDSAVFQTLLSEVSEVLGETFGANKEELVKNVVKAIESALIFTTNLGLATVEAARVIYTAWKGVETVILAVETAIVGVGAGVAVTMSGVTGLAASLPGATQGMKDMAAESAENAEQLKAMTISLAEQTAEAAKATVGQSEFHDTLDRVGAMLMHLKDSMQAARDGTNEETQATDDNTEAQRKNREANEGVNNSLLNQTKLRELEKQGLQEATKLWDEYYQLHSARGGVTIEEEIAGINRWKENLTQKMKEAHTDTKAFYDALEALSKEKTEQALYDFDLLAEGSRSRLQEIAAQAQRNFEYAVAHASEFRQGFLDHLRAIRDQAVDDARGMGKAYESALTTVGVKAEEAASKLDKMRDSAKKAAQEVNQSFSFEVTKENVDQVIDSMKLDRARIYELLRKGLSLQQAVNVSRGAAMPTNPGPRVPGFAQGGTVGWVGEQGPELAALPTGTRIVSNHALRNTGSMVNHLTFNVYGQTEEQARRIKDLIIREVMTQRQFTRS